MWLLRRAFYLWRLGATGFAFIELGVGGFLLAITIIPLATLAVRDRETRTRRAQKIIRASFRFYVRMLRLFGVIKFDVVGKERLEAARGNLIIANHPTLLDAVLIMSLVPNAPCVVKHQLFRNPFLRHVVEAAGYIRNDQDPEDFIADCRRVLAAGNNLIIFPEGTRSVPGRAMHLQRGFAHIAPMTGADIQLVTITCNPITLTKGQAWYVIPERSPLFRMEIDEQVTMQPYLDFGSRPLGARRLVSYVEAYYGRKLRHV